MSATVHQVSVELSSVTSTGAFETWLLLEYADRGALDKAVGAGRFRRKSDGTPELARISYHRVYLQHHRTALLIVSILSPSLCHAA